MRCCWAAPQVRWRASPPTASRRQPEAAAASHAGARHPVCIHTRTPPLYPRAAAPKQGDDPLPTWYRCRCPGRGAAPDCVCPSVEPPAGLSRAETPQFVLFTVRFRSPAAGYEVTLSEMQQAILGLGAAPACPPPTGAPALCGALPAFPPSHALSASLLFTARRCRERGDVRGAHSCAGGQGERNRRLPGFRHALHPRARHQCVAPKTNPMMPLRSLGCVHMQCCAVRCQPQSAATCLSLLLLCC